MSGDEKRAGTAPPLKIARASARNLADVWRLLGEYYAVVDVTYRDTTDEVERFLESGDSGYGMWLAYVGQAAAGCVVLRPLPEIPRAGECKRLYVRAEFRGRGISKALLAAMEDCAARLSLQWVYLDTKDDLHAAITLYERSGYRRCPRYNENPQATIFMRKSIGSKGTSERH